MMAEIIVGVKNNVLRKGYHRMTCPFGEKRTYKNTAGVTKTDAHNGVDLTGNPSVDDGYDYIVAIADGKVVTAAYSTSGAGYYVKIDHGNGIYTRYMHQKAGSLKVKKGELVKKGQVLGYMGETGNVTGRHLHFDICINGVMVDPVPFLKGAKEIVSTAASEYKSGNFKTKVAVNVRKGPGTNFDKVPYSDFTVNAKAQVKALDKSCPDEFPAGTKVTVSQVSGTWGKCPSGWISLKYCERA